MPKALYVANWKMNLLRQEAANFCSAFLDKTANCASLDDVGIAPPLSAFDMVKGSLEKGRGIMVGTQNVHWLDSGAHTGEISAKMLVDIGADFAIIGHSERRQFYGETDETAYKRVRATVKAGLKAILCIGESEAQFKAGKTEEVVLYQLQNSLGSITEAEAKNVILAYEPVWAIGTGLAATPEIAQNVHAFIRKELKKSLGAAIADEMVILYGGSTKPDNIEELMSCPDINGALVGGASLKPDHFAELIINGRTGDKKK